MLNEILYRELAGQWHDGQWSSLYAYASTGTRLPSLSAEIKALFPLAKTRKELFELQRFYALVGPDVTFESVESTREFWNRTARNSDGSPLRCRANGRVKTWKTRPNEFRLPVKYGLRECFYITEATAYQWTIAP